MKIVKVIMLSLVSLLFIYSASIDLLAKSEPEEDLFISVDNAENGVVDVYYYTTKTEKMKVVVQRDKERYVYNLFSGEEETSYPLQLGDGTYSISVYKNTSGSKYKKLITKSVKIELEDPNIVYLQSIQEINWDYEDDAIIFTEEMLTDIAKKKGLVYPGTSSNIKSMKDEDKIEGIYNYILGAIEYDFEKIKGLDHTYLPDIDNTLDEGKGICYDYSSLLASMLRSEGIPTRMIKGYANTSDVYHAWNEIYIDEEWVVVDTTYDAYMYQNKKKFTFAKDSDDFNKVKFY